MNLKTIKIVSVINVFLISFLAHFLYDFLPSNLTAILFPVNESIFEHMKIIYTSTLLYGIIDYALLKINNIKYNNFIFQLFFTSFISILIFLVIYLPVHFFIGEYLILTIFLLFITYIISSIISYFLLNYEKIPYLNIISIPLIIIVYFIFSIYTFNPPQNFFFYDSQTKSYGIPNRTIK